MEGIERRIRDTLNAIPGYQGYRSLENRRDDDRRVRESIADDLLAVAGTLTRSGSRLVEQRKLQHVSAIERLVGDTRHLADRVRTATYGYGGLFSNRDVGAVVLDQIRQFDEAFLAEAAALDAIAGRLAGSSEGPLSTDIDAYRTEITRLNRLFDARSEVVDTAQPAQDAEVLALLEPTAPVVLSPVVGLARGDAIAILGDNYLVDAIVRIGSGDDAVTLARLGIDDNGNPLWLIGGDTATFTTTLGHQSSGNVPVGSVSKRAEASIETADDSRSGVPVQYGTGANGSFWYTIGNETRVFEGSPVVDADIQVYGQA